MKRLIIEGNWVKSPGGDWGLYDGSFPLAHISPLVAVTVEDIPDPLPTEPGVRFWGETNCAMPQWWFVLKSGQYAPMSGDSPHDPDECNLRRLPDPEVTP